MQEKHLNGPYSALFCSNNGKREFLRVFSCLKPPVWHDVEKRLDSWQKIRKFAVIKSFFDKNFSTLLTYPTVENESSKNEKV